MGTTGLAREVKCNNGELQLVIYRPSVIDMIDDVKYQQWALELNKLWKKFGKQVICHYCVATNEETIHYNATMLGRTKVYVLLA